MYAVVKMQVYLRKTCLQEFAIICYYQADINPVKFVLKAIRKNESPTQLILLLC